MTDKQHITLHHAAKRADYERYICTLFAPASQRPSLWAVIILANALMSVPASVSDEMVGMIKLKWWQEQLHYHSINDTHARQDHPVLAALNPALQAGSIAVSRCDTMIELLAQQCAATPTMQQASDTMAEYYRMFANIVGGDDAIYAIQGERAAAIGLIRAQSIKSGKVVAIDMRDYPACKSTSRFYGALQQHGNLWEKRISYAQQGDDIDMLRDIPFFALRLWGRVIWCKQ